MTDTPKQPLDKDASIFMAISLALLGAGGYRDNPIEYQSETTKGFLSFLGAFGFEVVPKIPDAFREGMT